VPQVAPCLSWLLDGRRSLWARVVLVGASRRPPAFSLGCLASCRPFPLLVASLGGGLGMVPPGRLSYVVAPFVGLWLWEGNGVEAKA
jgi:hypothetical protein